MLPAVFVDALMLPSTLINAIEGSTMTTANIEFAYMQIAK